MDQEVNLVTEAFKFMALGMGIVFFFLIALSVILNIQHKIISTFFKEKPITNNTTNQKHISNKLAAVITSSIQHFSKKV